MLCLGELHTKKGRKLNPLRIREERWTLGLESPWPSAEVWIGLIREEWATGPEKGGRKWIPGKEREESGNRKKNHVFGSFAFLLRSYIVILLPSQGTPEMDRESEKDSSIISIYSKNPRLTYAFFAVWISRWTRHSSRVSLGFCVIAPLHRFSNVFDIFKRFGTVIYIHRFYNKHYSHPLPRFFLWYVATAFFMLDLMSCWFPCLFLSISMSSYVSPKSAEDAIDSMDRTSYNGYILNVTHSFHPNEEYVEQYVTDLCNSMMEIDW